MADTRIDHTTLAIDEGLDNDFWKPLKAYWKEPASKEKREALRPFTKLEATKWQYTHGVKEPALVSPDAWTTDQYLLDRNSTVTDSLTDPRHPLS